MYYYSLSNSSLFFIAVTFLLFVDQSYCNRYNGGGGWGSRGRGWGRPQPARGGNHPGHGWGWNQNQNQQHRPSWNNPGSGQSLDSCERPAFTDVGATLLIENCNRNQRHEVCWNSAKRIPIGWKVFMYCSKDNIKIKQPSTCSNSGVWSHDLPESCDKIFDKYDTIIDQTNNSTLAKIPLISNHRPTSHTQSSQNLKIFPFMKTHEKPCSMLDITFSENFIFSCFMHHQSSAETLDCIKTYSHVHSGTVAVLRCRPPFYSRAGRISKWNCDNGEWKGDFSEKLKCFRSVHGNNKEQEVTSTPARTTTTEIPYSIPLPITEKPSVTVEPSTVRQPPRSSTQVNYWWTPPVSTVTSWTSSTEVIKPESTTVRTPLSSTTPVYGWFIPQTTITPDSFSTVKINAISSTTSTTPKILTSTVDTTAGYNPEILDLELLWTVPATTEPTTTSTVPSPTTITPYWYKYTSSVPSTIIPTPSFSSIMTTLRSTTTSTPERLSTPPPKIQIQCPPLKPRTDGMILECVTVIPPTATRSKQIFTNGCDIPQPPGTEAKYSCTKFYESTAGLSSIYRKCREDGTWSGSADTFNCIPQCGQKNQVLTPFITSGTPAVKGEWPWHVAIFQKNEEDAEDGWDYICGGTLISKRTILTAAHCITFRESSTLRNVTEFRFDLGRYELDKADEVLQIRVAESFHVHSSYSPFGYDSDIAIVVLKESVDIGYHVRPICYPKTLNSAQEELMVTENTVGVVVGWGATESQAISNTLQLAELRVVSQKECSAGVRGVAGGGRLQIKFTTYCAAPSYTNDTATGPGKGKPINVCTGDSGGGMYFPLTSANSDFTKWHLQGIVSVGIGDESNKCQANQFSFFTRIGRYADWLVRVMSESDAL